MSSTLTTERASARSQKTTKITLEIGNRRGTIKVSRRTAEIILAAIDEDCSSFEEFLLGDLSACMYGATADALRETGRYDWGEIYRVGDLLDRARRRVATA